MPPAALPASYQTRLMPSLLDGGPSAFAGSGVIEQLWWTTYDRVAITTAVAATPVMFQNAGTDPLVSNFEGNGGAFPQGQAFWACGLRFIPDMATTLVNVQNLLKYIAILFSVDNAKKYTYAPAWNYPSGVGIQSENLNGTAAVTAASYGNSGIPSVGNFYQFKAPVALRPQQRFTIQLQVNSGITLAGGPINCYVALDGWLQRNIQ